MRRLTLLVIAGGACVAALAAVALGINDRSTPQLVRSNAASAIATAPPGAHVRLGAGVHSGPLVIHRPVTLSAEPGARIVAPESKPGVLVAGTSGVRLRDLHVTGGSSGIEVRHSDDVTLADITVRGSRLHGIFVHDAEVEVTDCAIAGLRSDLAQGFEIINSDTRGDSVVDGCTVTGPVFEGISSHVSRVTFTDNVVTGSTERGIVITEMSMGSAMRNLVSEAHGAGYFCGDMSRCAFLDNRARGIASADDGWRSSAGHGLVVHFHSTATVKRLQTSDVGGDEILLILDSHLVRHPSSGPPPLAPIVGVAGLYLVLLAAARLAGLRGALAVLLPTVALQVGHQIEHVVQAGQVILGHSSTHGLAGAVVDTEWMHLAFNAVLLAGIAASHPAAWRGRARPAAVGLVAVQGYHVVEHVVRVGQYVVTGISPAPGLIGTILGTGESLIWFHFGINTVITALLVVSALSTRPWSLEVPSLIRPRAVPALGRS